MTKLCNTCEYIRYCARSGIEDVGCDRYKMDTTTNEEWLRSATFEELANTIFRLIVHGTVIRPDREYIKKWLKEKHNG